MNLGTDTTDGSETTRVFEKSEDVLACALGILSKIHKSHDLCLDRWGASAILGNKSVKDAFIAVSERGAKVRLITEIEDVNLDYCKEFMKFAEVRHLDKVEGNFSVSDGKWYTASAIAEKDKPPPRLIYSTVREIAEQHQHFFETLWAKAVPADRRIGEIEGNAVAERTEVIYGEEDSVNMLMQAMRRTKKTAVACSSSVIPIFCMTIEPVKQTIIEAKERGVMPRQITEITKENLPYCKEFMSYVELRHMSNVQGNMMVTDNNEYLASASVGTSSASQAIYSNAKTIIEQQRLFFENLWNKAIPAEQRIRELEEGIESINLEIFASNQESGARGIRMVQNAKEEVLVLFPSTNVLNAASSNLGIVDMYNQIAKRGVTVKILVQTDKDSPSSEIDAVKKEILPLIQLRTLHQEEEGDKDMSDKKGIRMAILVADNKEVIVWNMLDMNSPDLYQMAGNAIYSSNPSVVSSYYTIFDSLWKQVKMYEQIKVHDQLQKEFINVAAHELRTPIQPLLGTAEMLEASLGSSGEAKITKRDVDMIIRNARRLERLSADILTVSRIETQSLQLYKEEFDLEKKIRNVIADIEPYIKNNARDLQIVFRTADESVIVEADRSKIFEVLSNLIGNAIKFTEQGTITVSVKRQGGQAVVSIKDTGIGIDPKVMPRLFEKFVMTGKRAGGTGLGLFISKSIIEAHGGKTWAENNEDGQGATFYFTLPLTAAKF